MSWTWWAYKHSEPLFMWALEANFTILGICMCSTELLPRKNQKRSTRYPMTLQKRDSISDIFPWVDLGRGYRGHVPPPPRPQFFLELRTSKIYKTNINKIYLIKLRLKEMTCLMIIAKTKKTFSAFQLLYSGSGKSKKHYQPVTRTG